MTAGVRPGIVPLSRAWPQSTLEGNMPEEDRTWRVGFWFLTRETGWTHLEYAFIKARDRDAAMAYGAQRAERHGFRFNKDTKIKADYEEGILE
jgi:hypothetical protein